MLRIQGHPGAAWRRGAGRPSRSSRAGTEREKRRRIDARGPMSPPGGRAAVRGSPDVGRKISSQLSSFCVTMRGVLTYSAGPSSHRRSATWRGSWSSACWRQKSITAATWSDDGAARCETCGLLHAGSVPAVTVVQAHAFDQAHRGCRALARGRSANLSGKTSVSLMRSSAPLSGQREAKTMISVAPVSCITDRMLAQ